MPFPGPETVTPEELGRRIANLRDKPFPKFDQGQMAKRLGVPQTTLARWEQGKVRIKAEDLYRIAVCVGVSLDFLMSPPGTDSVHLHSKPHTDMLKSGKAPRSQWEIPFLVEVNSSVRVIRDRAEAARFSEEVLRERPR